MTDKQFADNYIKKEREEIRRRDSRIFHIIILVCLPLFFAGYFYALYRGNNSNVSSYSLLILAFSAAGSNVLFTGKKMEQRWMERPTNDWRDLRPRAMGEIQPLTLLIILNYAYRKEPGITVFSNL